MSDVTSIRGRIKVAELPDGGFRATSGSFAAVSDSRDWAVEMVQRLIDAGRLRDSYLEHGGLPDLSPSEMCLREQIAQDIEAIQFEEPRVIAMCAGIARTGHTGVVSP